MNRRQLLTSAVAAALAPALPVEAAPNHNPITRAFSWMIVVNTSNGGRVIDYAGDPDTARERASRLMTVLRSGGAYWGPTKEVQRMLAR